MAQRKTKSKKEENLTREERIARAWKSWESSRDSLNQMMPTPPQCRQLAIGDELEIGSLVNCVVAGLSDDQRYVLVEYTQVNNNYGSPIETDGCFNVWAWVDVIPKAQIELTTLSTSRLRPTLISSDVSALTSNVFSRGVIDNPDYQRGYEWTLEDKQRLIGSIMAERNIGNFLFVQFGYVKNQGMLEIMDGKQRLNAIIDFVTSRFTYEGKYYHQLSRRDRVHFDNFRVNYAYLDGERMTRAELLETFLEVNSSGVPQSQEHLQKVREMLALERAVA